MLYVHGWNKWWLPMPMTEIQNQKSPKIHQFEFETIQDEMNTFI